LEVPKSDVKGKTHQSIKLPLAINSSRAISGHATLKPLKVLSKDSVNLSHREGAIPAIGYR
jgi:hypothetical protein